jgi:hypothetical protein
MSLVVVLLGALGACGGGGGGLTAEDKQWIAAAEAGLDSSQLPSATAAQKSCLATALITKITVKRMKDAGATLADLKDPNKNLPKKLEQELPQNTRLALGAAMQKCDFGKIMAPAFTKGFGSNGKPSSNDIACVADGIDAPGMRSMVAGIALANDSLSRADALSLSQVLVKCIDFAPLFGKQFNMTFSSAETACIKQTLGADPDFTNALAAEFSGSSDQSGFVSAGKRILPCLTPAHIAQIGQASK